MDRTGWFADVDDDDPPTGYPWRLHLQVPGACHSLSGPWFRTEEDALEWLRAHVIGQGEHDG